MTQQSMDLSSRLWGHDSLCYVFCSVIDTGLKWSKPCAQYFQRVRSDSCWIYVHFGEKSRYRQIIPKISHTATSTGNNNSTQHVLVEIGGVFKSRNDTCTYDTYVLPQHLQPV
ncbi:unnamed protein product [Ectocarpus sp. 8 AP-2014]